MKTKGWILIVLAVMGLIDAGYLTWEHYSQVIPPCPANPSIWVDCGVVLRSKYAVMGGVPLAVWGVVNYGLLLVWLIVARLTRKFWAKILILGQTFVGLTASIYFVYLQLGVIKSICTYCMVSALVSLILFILSQIFFATERKMVVINTIGWVYQKLVKKILFLVDPEKIHIMMVDLGEGLALIPGVNLIIRWLVKANSPILSQTLSGIKFNLPVGLAAGFDYEAKLTKTLEPWSFGFQTVGTVTNLPCEGNDKPRLGRLPKSRSLMVNKGFRNPGAEKVGEKLTGMSFGIPVGISIGRTNIRGEMSEQEAINDVVDAFKKFEKRELKNAYYELNISCPNLYGKMSFYPKETLNRLLVAVDGLKLGKPVFVKMPISETNKQTMQMLEVIAKHSPLGVILGNLQKNRKDPSLDQNEVAKWTGGNFSGKPTYHRSNELISMTYRKYKKRFVIIGCGGVFSALDAYTKIKKGASLIQLITGMIYMGPQLVAKINLGLVDLLRRDGYNNISEVVGVEA